MSLLQAFVLGLVQGLTEFLPISSSGFLILVPEFFGWKIQTLAYDAVLHLATLLAVVIALWPEVQKITMSFFARKKDEWGRVGWMILLATIPVLVIGYFFNDVIEASTRSVQVIAYSFIIWGIVLFLADRFSSQKETSIETVKPTSALFIGLAQVIALIPGTSRSGITITAGLFSRLGRRDATRFAFLLAIPTILAAGLLKTVELITSPEQMEFVPLVVGFFTAFFAALLVLKFLFAFLQRYTYASIALLRIALGIVLLLL